MLQRIFAATGRLIVKRGIGSITIDAVALEAGISKGGVLHHFRSKDALITAMALQKLQALKDGLAANIASSPGTRNRTLSGMIAHGAEQHGEPNSFPRALLVAAVANSASLSEFRGMFTEVMDAIEAEASGPEQELRGVATFYTVVGILITQSLGVAELSPQRARAMFDLLLDDARETRA